MHEVRLPQMGQSVEEASIVTWFKQEGETVTAGEPLFSIQTDKAEIECESPASGTLRKILVAPDVVVPVLTIVALVGDPAEPLPDLGGPAAPTAAAPPAPEPAAAPAGSPAAPSAAPASAAGEVFVSPRARTKARELGVDPATMQGSGVGGRVIEADVLAQAQRAAQVRVTPTAKRVAEAAGVDVAALAGSGPRGKVMKADVVAAAGAKAPEAAAPVAAVPAEGVQRVPHTAMRRIIARRMSESKFSAPHYYITVEVDAAAMRETRGQITAYKVSINDMVLAGVVRALREFPGVNARWGEDAIEVVSDINLGIAVALPAGLIVPVLKQAQNLSLEGVATQSRALIEKARNGKLLPDDFSGNTFTVSNLGPFGVDHFTAIINQPDSAILAVGQMKDRPVAIDGGIYIRPVMKLTMSSDHRVIDGAVAAQFMGRLKEILETAGIS